MWPGFVAAPPGVPLRPGKNGKDVSAAVSGASRDSHGSRRPKTDSRGNMSMASPPEVREGYFPNWKLKTTGVIMPEERLPWGQTIISGMQHGVAMAGGTIIAPLIMGFDPNRALLFSGVGTLIFFVVVAGRVPSYLGSSFAFVAVVIAASGYSGHGPNPNLDVALGGIIAAGVLYGIIALIVMQSGVSWIERLMPPSTTIV